MKNTFIKTHDVSSYTVDYNKKYTLCALLRHAQSEAFYHAQEMGIDGKKIWDEYKAIWIITRLRVDMEQMPDWSDVIEVETYPLAPGLVRMERECLLRHNGQVFARVSSEWVILDKDRGMPRRPAKTGYPMDLEHREGRVAGEYTNFAPEYTEQDFVYAYMARVSDLDMNMHVNNIAYVRLAQDVFTLTELKDKRLTSFEIVFKAQSYEGDELRLYRKEIGDGVYYVSAVNSDGKRIFDTMFTYEKEVL